MKKIIVIVLGLFLLTGCTKVNDLSYDEIISKVVSSQIELNNEYRNGYKYYVPRGLRVEINKEFNEKIVNNH